MSDDPILNTTEMMPIVPSSMERMETRIITVAGEGKPPLALQSGAELAEVKLAYETWGSLNARKDNAILLFHALSGSHHAAGYNAKQPGNEGLWSEDLHVGWWEDFIGPGKAIDTRDFFVICINYLGGCYGSTGPRSINPATGKPWAGSFPVVTVGDVVNSQVRVLDELGIEKLAAAIGGSLGGVLATDLAMRYPDRVRGVIPIASGIRATTLQRLHNFEQIYAIENDPDFNFGNYYEGRSPDNGLTLARMISHKNYVHLWVMEERAKSELHQDEDDLHGYKLQHQIESYILHKGKKFIKRFDANTYLRILYLWQSMHLVKEHGDGNAAEAARRCAGQRFLILTIDSDVCFWPDEQAELADALREAGVDYRYLTVHSFKGHDSFLLEPELYTPNIQYFLRELKDDAG